MTEKRKEIVDKGWDRMNVILDREMPVKKKRRWILLFPLLFVGIAFLGSSLDWFGSSQDMVYDKSTSTSTPIDQNLIDENDPLASAVDQSSISSTTVYTSQSSDDQPLEINGEEKSNIHPRVDRAKKFSSANEEATIKNDNFQIKEDKKSARITTRTDNYQTSTSNNNISERTSTIIAINDEVLKLIDQSTDFENHSQQGDESLSPDNSGESIIALGSNEKISTDIMTSNKDQGEITNTPSMPKDDSSNVAKLERSIASDLSTLEALVLDRLIIGKSYNLDSQIDLYNKRTSSFGLYLEAGSNCAWNEYEYTVMGQYTRPLSRKLNLVVNTGLRRTNHSKYADFGESRTSGLGSGEFNTNLPSTGLENSLVFKERETDLVFRAMADYLVIKRLSLGLGLEYNRTIDSSLSESDQVVVFDDKDGNSYSGNRGSLSNSNDDFRIITSAKYQINDHLGIRGSWQLGLKEDTFLNGNNNFKYCGYSIGLSYNF